MADTGYFDSVSANLKTGVGAQVKGISEGVKGDSAGHYGRHCYHVLLRIGSEIS